MPKIDLRAYVIAHPNDKAAFHAFVDRFTSEASTETFDIPKSNYEVQEVEILIRQKLAQMKTKKAKCRLIFQNLRLKFWSNSSFNFYLLQQLNDVLYQQQIQDKL